jgi:succinyl-CoA synthetase beta subunit
MEILERALARGRRALTEYEGKKLLAAYGIPVTREVLAENAEAAASAAEEIGYPVAVKGSGVELMHKSESGVVFVNVGSRQAVLEACGQIKERLGASFEGILVQEMVPGKRELVMGLHREPQFGACVMLGIGGVLTEIIDDTSFRIAPFDQAEALDMADQLRMKEVFSPFRGEAGVDMELLGRCLSALGRIGLDNPAVFEIDVNPLIVTPDGNMKAVDALVVVKDGEDAADH